MFHFADLAFLIALPLASAGQEGPSSTPEPDFVLDLPVHVSGDYVRDLPVGIDQGGTAYFEADELRLILEEYLRADFIDDLVLPTGHTLVSDAALRAAGLAITYDQTALAVEIELPLDAQLDQSLSLRGAPPRQKPTAEQADLAAGISIEVSPDYILSGEDEGFAPLRGRADGFVNVGGFRGAHFVWRASYAEAANDPFVLNEAILFKDLPESAVRVAAGTLRPINAGIFSRPVEVVGAGVFRDYAAIQPLTNLRPDGATRFTLEQDSLVTVLVNGAPVFTERLGAGAYDLRDLPVRPGGNDVIVVVEDDVGRRDLAVFSTFVDNELLGRGRSRFSVIAGAVRERAAFPRASDEIAYAGFYERGVTDQVTVGLAVEGVDDEVSAIGKAAVGLPIGVLSTEFAAQSTKAGDAIGALARFSWQSDPSNAYSQNLDVQLSYTSEGFGPIQPGSDRFVLGRRAPAVWEANVRYGFRLPAVSLTASGRFADTGDEEVFAATLGANRAFGALAVGVNARYRNSRNADGTTDSEEALLVTLSRRFGRGTRARASYDSEERASQLQLLRFDGRAVGDWDGRVLLLDNDRSEVADVAVGAIFNRSEVTARARAERRGGRETVRVGTSVGIGLGIAGGQVAVGRPFDDGFVIAQTHSSLGERPLQLVRGEGDVIASSGPLGPALLPLRGAYRSERTSISVEDLPVGYDLGGDQIITFAGARAGYAYTAGSGASNTFIGTLLTRDGLPMALAVGALVRRDDPEAEPANFFTNRTGRLVAEGLRPGVYDITLKPDGRIVGEIVIPDEAEGLVRGGDLIMTRN